MKATFTNRMDKFTASHRKENAFSKQYAGVICDRGEIKEPVTVRIYSTDSRVYACVWVNASGYRHGSAYAGGYGYHRASAAVGESIKNCGIDLDKDIDGRGDGAIREAIEAIVAEIYAGNETVMKTFTVIEAHP